jgi:hypothetical protein
MRDDSSQIEKERGAALMMVRVALRFLRFPTSGEGLKLASLLRSFERCVGRVNLRERGCEGNPFLLGSPRRCPLLCSDPICLPGAGGEGGQVCQILCHSMGGGGGVDLAPARWSRSFCTRFRCTGRPAAQDSKVEPFSLQGSMMA